MTSAYLTNDEYTKYLHIIIPRTCIPNNPLGYILGKHFKIWIMIILIMWFSVYLLISTGVTT